MYFVRCVGSLNMSDLPSFFNCHVLDVDHHVSHSKVVLEISLVN